MTSELSPTERSNGNIIVPLAGIGTVVVLFACGFRLLLLQQMAQARLSASISMLTLFAALFCLGMGLLIRKGNIRNTKSIAICALLLGLALFLRICCLDYASGDYNTFLVKWAAFFRENGGFAALSEPIGDYNVPYLYFLAAISYTGLPDLYMIKFFSIVFELLSAWGVFLLTQHLVTAKQEPGAGYFLPGFISHAPLIAFFITLFLPTAFFNGAVWGQCDSIYAAFVLFSIYAALQRKGGQAVILIAIAFSFKLQAVFVLPLFLIFLFTRHVKWYQLFLFPLVYCIICLPAILLGRPFLDVFTIYLHQTSSYPALTLNAPSLATFIPATADTTMWSKICIAAAFLFVLALVVISIIRRTTLGSRSLFVLGLLFAIGVPLLLPHMHERYFYLAEVMSIVWACARIDRIFLPALIQVASLSGYHAYLAARYIYPMKYGAVLFCLSIPILLYDLFQLSSPRYAAPATGKEEESIPVSSPHSGSLASPHNPDEAGIDLSIIAELADAPPELEQDVEDLSSDLPSALQMSSDSSDRHFQE